MEGFPETSVDGPVSLTDVLRHAEKSLDVPEIIPGLVDVRDHKVVAQFTEADQILLQEARERFEFEHKVAGALHQKSVFFLTCSGFFSALVAGPTAKVIEHWSGGALQWARLGTLSLCLGLLLLVMLLLSRSALSSAYSVPPDPAKWRRYLATLREALPPSASADSDILSRFRFDILDAWVAAATQCVRANDEKAQQIERVSRLFPWVVAMTLVGMALFFVDVFS